MALECTQRVTEMSTRMIRRMCQKYAVKVANFVIPDQAVS